MAKPKKKEELYFDRERLILDHLPLVKITVERISQALPPQVDREDLMEAGIVGLIEAANRFDPLQGNDFSTYAKFRIRGAILDELRVNDWVPKSLRQKSREMEEVFAKLELKLGRPPTDEEMAQELGMKYEEYLKLINKMSYMTIFSFEELGKILLDKEGAEDIIPDPYQKDPFEEAELAERVNLLAEVIDELPEREKLVITLYYYEELTIREIAEVLGLAKSTVSEIHTKAILRMRGKLKAKLGEPTNPSI